MLRGPHPSCRDAGVRGMTLIEALAALAILGFALLASIAVVAWSDRIETQARERALALELASSVAERVRVAPTASLASGQVDLSSEYVALDGAEVQLVVKEDEELQLKRVDVVVTWGGAKPRKLVLPTAVGSAGIYR